MREKLKSVFGLLNTRPVFVIGTGRSGTHWLGYTLADHPEVRATIEVQPMFDLSKRIALNPELEEKLFGRLVLVYRWQLFISAPRLYLDKTHPNIWLAEKLKDAFPQSLFIGIKRNPYGTVASMMNHKGVSAWHKRWRDFPIPNRFLGITSELSDTYEDIPFASQCAMRWLSHHDRMNDLRNILGSDLFVITYETFVHNPENTTNELQKFLGLNSPIQIPNVNTASLHKWKSQLSCEEVKQIQNVIGSSPDNVNNGEANS